MKPDKGPRNDCDTCRHCDRCKGCLFLQLAANLDSPAVAAMLQNYCRDPRAAGQCVRRLALEYYDLILPADIMPDGRSCFEDAG